MTRHAARAPFDAARPAGPASAHPGRPGPAAVDPGLLEVVRRSVLAEAGPVTELRVASAVRESGRLLGAAGSLAAMDRINAELNGLGPLQPLALDPSVTDIFVNAPDSVWLDRGAGPEPVEVSFDGEAALRALAVRLIAAGGRRLDDSSPCVDVKIAPGYRIHAVLPPVSSSGTLLSIRIGRRRSFTLGELQSDGCVHPAVAVVLRRIIDTRLGFLVSGATGAGKTTLLATLLGLCQPCERLVLIEDAAELEPNHPHVLTLEARHANAEGAGSIDLQELVRQALRMSPGRLIVGECRGLEVRELLMALNTGHSGGGGTIHANSAADVPARLAALGVLAGMSIEAVALQASSALDVVIHVDRDAGGRRVSGIGVVGLRDGRLAVVTALAVGPAPPSAPDGPSPAGGQVSMGPAWPELADRLGLDPGFPEGRAPWPR
ncbi:MULTISPECIES: TadA family conjugal transfer-associated ATPase [unclassified Arthrobacter]|uniref:TadA family conjugal transfer-associated ATPase n=1 Tax=unclassified Arthrobacter TaxID=235627 RepID=UPI00159D8FA9|nr:MULTISPECIES: TadA family conjugal transfer-associated ATPase [unclassified Arthrobacter]MCQ9165157.1 TadA family conjugal transfer-associated ATPase [Arthrobacter sp. STN4]NVM99750.1 TadA family conjugal transfer-associated ATPase [Arthrobacter sp. SDTb3-6]